jgi:hypothetical protein
LIDFTRKPAMSFVLEPHCNAYLPASQTRVDVILKLRADLGAAPAASGPLEYGIIVDCSGSMTEAGKITAAKLAVRSAIARIPDGVTFFVVAFNTDAHVLSGAAVANAQTRSEADHAVARLGADGGTSMAAAIVAASKLFSQNPNAVRVSHLFTDGENTDAPGVLDKALAQAKGRFQCQCRGIGADWKPQQLLQIAEALLGEARIVANGEAMAADLRDTFARASSLRAADVKLRFIVPPKMARVVSVRQMSPTIVDLTNLVVAADDRTFDYSTGAWGAEERDYHVVLDMKQPGAVGEQLRVARTAIVHGGQVEDQPAITVTWSDDDRQTTLIDPQVAHFTGQAELAEAQREGLAALDRGDAQTATVKLGRAIQLAQQSGNEDATVRLKKIVDVVDAEQGTVRLRAGVNKADLLDAEVSATRTVRRAPAKAS